MQQLTKVPAWALPRSAWAAGIVGYVFLLRLGYSSFVELLPEESYYWNYSRHLDIGYLDHPPLVAWLIRSGTTLFGDTEFGVRFGALCCGVITSLFLFRLTRNLFDDTTAWCALILSQVLPFFFMSGLLMTPDAPLTAAWAAALYFLERGLVGGRANAWLWAGLALGVGLLSKYTIALLGASAAVFMVLDPASRYWFRRWEPYAAVLIAVVVFAPVIVWNSHHAWVSFAFQTSRRLAEQPQFSLHKLIGAALVLITPTGIFAVAVAFMKQRAKRRAAADTGIAGRQWGLLEVCVVVPLTVFFFFSLRHEVKLDWTGAPWVAGIPMLALGMAQAATWEGPGTLLWLRRAWPPTLLILLCIYGVGLYYLALGIPAIGYSIHTELVPVGWRNLGQQVESVADDLRASNGGRVLIVGMDRYAIASELAFYSGDRIRSVAETSTGHLFSDMGLMYEQWFPRDSQVGSTLLLVAWDAGTLAESRLANHVTRVGAIHECLLVSGGRAVRRFYYRVAYGYRA